MLGVVLGSLLLLAVAHTPGTDYAGVPPGGRVDPAAGARLASGPGFGTSHGDAIPARFADAALPLAEGRGGPILVIRSAAHPFSGYPVEILRAEGLNLFATLDLPAVTPGVLAAHEVVILGEMPVASAQARMLSAWVEAGGTLIALRPDKRLAGLFGLSDAGGTLSDAYLRVDRSTAAGAGITGEALQFHGAADLYSTAGAAVVATLCSDAVTATTHPAVTVRDVGANGGQAIAFTYDLARSVVYTRQGNPAWAGQERDGVAPIRSDDLFYGAAANDPQPDWVDLSKVAIPQADEQQRLLANLILLGNLDHQPLPRFWYFPNGARAVVVMTGDNHGDGGMAPRFDLYRRQSPADCSEPDWECVRATGYQFVRARFTPAQAAFYHSLGFEVAVHVSTHCADWTPAQLDSSFANQFARVAAAFPGLPAPATNRTHCVAWSDWSSLPEVGVEYGIRLDTNYYYWPAAWVRDRPGMFTGSGMPMRFARLDGSLIDCYQVATQMTDESGQTYPMTVDSLLERALDARGYYGAFCANMHFDLHEHPTSDAIVASALARGVPVVSARQLLEWLDGRNGSSFSAIHYREGALRFALAVAAGARNLQAMLPAVGPAGRLSGLTRDGAPVGFTTETLKGIEYAVFPAEPGSHVATYGTPAVAAGVEPPQRRPRAPSRQ